MYNIPTYEEALAITEQSEAFYVQYGEISGYRYAMFNYRMALYEDFINDKWDARELRGLTYIASEGEWECYPMLQKFWNLNENVSTQYGLVKDKKVESVEYKEDGSLITLIRLPNGEVVPKTKMSFDNDQTAMVSKWLESHPEVVEEVQQHPLLQYFFELVSPKNKIVLKYPSTELRLLQIRGQITGQYFPPVFIQDKALTMGIPFAHVFENTLDELIALRETQENIEGWVIKFEDGQMVKLKTEWYVAAHGLMDDLSKEHKIIEMIMNETIDDVLSELESGSEERDDIEEIMGLIENYYNHRVNKAEELKEIFLGEYKSNRKNFAIRYNKTEDFGIVMRNLSDDADIAKAVKERVLVDTAHLEKARDLLDKLRKEQELEDWAVDKMVNS